MDWLATIREESGRGAVPPGDKPWVPPILANVPPEAVGRLHYVVLDDVDDADGDVVVVAEEWPTVDALGRVRHATGTSRETYVQVERWQALMKRRRIPEEVRSRAPRIGDAFAMLLGTSGDVTKPKGPVVDVTADAREAARMAYYGAVAMPMDARLADRMRDREAGTPIVVDLPAEWVPRGKTRRVTR